MVEVAVICYRTFFHIAVNETGREDNTLRINNAFVSVEKVEKDCSRAGSNDSKEAVVSVIIPAYNEEKTLSSVIQRSHETLRNFGWPYEIIVVDDGSTDKTANVALQNGVIVISNGLNRGKGHALTVGIRKARGSILIMMDADGAHQPEEIPKLLYPILSKNPGVRVVVGSRFLGNLEERAISRIHFIGNKILNLSIKLLTGKWVTDSQSGFRSYRREVLKEFNFKSLGFEIETEMTIKALKRGLLMKEVPITCKRRSCSTSRLNTFKDGFTILKTIFDASLSET